MVTSWEGYQENGYSLYGQFINKGVRSKWVPWHFGFKWTYCTSPWPWNSDETIADRRTNLATVQLCQARPYITVLFHICKEELEKIT